MKIMILWLGRALLLRNKMKFGYENAVMRYIIQGKGLDERKGLLTMIDLEGEDIFVASVRCVLSEIWGTACISALSVQIFVRSAALLLHKN